jgi:hypothetical protein
MLIYNLTFTAKWMVIPTQETSNMASFLDRVQCDPLALIQVVKTTQSLGGRKKLAWSLRTTG